MASHSPASHRRPRSAPSRTAVTLALASAASVSLLGESSASALTPAEVRARVDTLYRQAEQATEQYNGAKADADAARRAVADLQDELARKTARLNAARDAIGTLAAAQYRSGSLDPAVQLALSSTPDAYLERAGLLDRLGAQQSAALARIAAQQRDIARTREEAGARLAALRSAQSRLAARKRDVQARLRAAQALLSRTPGAAAAVPAATATGSATRFPDIGTPAPAPTTRAARAVAFAYRALGLPYIWGATGPNSYDCSGLTQAAWRAAGVSLPRTTFTQITAGPRVPRSALQPGDLVFFYPTLTHVGLYIGDGRMIHAPHPGAPVRIAPIDQMPFAGAVRPA